MFLRSVFFAATALILTSACFARAEAKRPNVLFILVDDLGWADIGFNNPDTFYETPNVDALAEEAVNFTSGYSVNPVCSPSRYGIETAKYPTRAGLTNFLAGERKGRFAPAPLTKQISRDEITIARKFKEGGYATFFAGKYHLGTPQECWPENLGYDINKGGCGFGSPKSYFSPYKNPRLSDGPDGEYLPLRLAAETKKFLEENKGKPFFAMLSFYLVHTPLKTDKKLEAKYAAKAAKLGLNPKGEFKQLLPQVWPIDEPRLTRINQSNPAYAAMMETMDSAVGIVLNTLKEQGLKDDTIVVFFADNGGLSTGEAFSTSNLPLKGGKGWVYEGGVREPAIIAVPEKFLNPSSNSGKYVNFKCDVPVASIDFYPTLCELAGIKINHDIDGVSLTEILKQKADARGAIFWHYPHYSNQGGMPAGAVREGDWKLIESFEDGALELYNLKEDVGENNNLAYENPQKAAELKAKLHAWYKVTGAKFLERLDGGPEAWRPQD